MARKERYEGLITPCAVKGVWQNFVWYGDIAEYPGMGKSDGAVICGVWNTCIEYTRLSIIEFSVLALNITS